MDKMLNDLTDEDIKNNIAIKIKEYMYNHKQEDLAQAIGANRSSISLWQNGKNAPRDCYTLYKLSVELNCSLDELLCGYTKREIETAKKTGLTKKSIKILKHYNIPAPTVLFGNLEYKPSFNRLINYMICKNENIVVSSNKGDIGNFSRSMLNTIFKDADECIRKIRDIIYNNKEYQGKSYQELKEIKKCIPTKVNEKIKNLPKIVEYYIADEIDKKVDAIIGL